MANTSVKGKVVNENNNVMANIIVKAYDVDPLRGRQLLGTTLTDSNGDFIISYSPSAYAFLIDRFPDIVIELWQNGGRVQVEREVSDVHEDILEMGDIVLSISGINTALKGIVVDEYNHPISGLIVIGYADVRGRESELGQATTDSSGIFSLEYSIYDWGWPKKLNPDLWVYVFDSLGIGQLFSSPIYTEVNSKVFQVPTINLQRDLAEGLVVTLGTGTILRLSTNNAVDVFVDNESAFAAMGQSINGASSTIHLLQLSFETDLAATFIGTSVQVGQFFVDALKDVSKP